MTTTTTNYFLIGMFVLGGTAIAVIAAMALGAGALREGVMYETYLSESVQGLDQGAPVRFVGVRLGKVVEIQLASVLYETDASHVVVRFSLEPGEISREQLERFVHERLDQGLHVRLASQGLTGALCLEAELSDEPVVPLSHDWLPAFPLIPSRTSTIRQLEARVQEFLSKLGEVDTAGLVARIDGLVEAATPVVEAATPAVEAVRRAADQVATALDSADLPGLAERLRRIADGADMLVTEARNGVRGVAEDAQSALREFQALARQLDGAAEPGRLNRMVEDLETTLRAMPATVAKLDLALDRAGTVLDRVGGVASVGERQLDAILGDVRGITRDLASLASTLERYPSLLLFANPPARGDAR